MNDRVYFYWHVEGFVKAFVFETNSPVMLFDVLSMLYGSSVWSGKKIDVHIDRYYMVTSVESLEIKADMPYIYLTYLQVIKFFRYGILPTLINK